ncbi:hypothetical protein WOLCODRAFT_133275 [Wolfiporia cocos MD-104 SS10]|uniref:F-box domain-containing protein n=1 Tax=Wolfiporia cocos (strain MD-104) TaxID=742152 RepID=A0A2H3K025_WOLCO|nr:hypothetical protein WOLCODRAFT_133275 [Wolfiporia cocos MD-104 SS10]
MPVQSSPLCQLPAEILIEIALDVTIPATPHGSPIALAPLLLTCKVIYFCLRFDRCAPLYADIFRSKFDTRAAVRRMGKRAKESSGLAAQLKKHCTALHRVRAGDIYSEHLEQDLWTMWTMTLENDGRNEAHLDWARLDVFLDAYLRTRLWDSREQYHNWPAESTANSLAIWLYWSRLTAARSFALVPQQRKQLQDLLRPFVITTLRYPSFCAPDNHFCLPLPRDISIDTLHMFETPHGFYPLYRDPKEYTERINHYGKTIVVAPPLIAQGAKLLYMTLSDIPFQVPDSLPLTREIAVQLGWMFVGPTQEDLVEANSHRSVKLIGRGDWDWDSRLSEEERRFENGDYWRTGLRAKSAKWENDWYRMRDCANPWKKAAGITYTFGMLTGLWQGRILIPAVDEYFTLNASTELPADFSDQNPRLFTMPTFMNLREHHCIMPAIPAGHGGSKENNDDGICNGWFPSVQISESRGMAFVRTHKPNITSQYETYVEGRPNSHSEETCPACLQRREHEECMFRARIQANALAAGSHGCVEAGLSPSSSLCSSPSVTKEVDARPCQPGMQRSYCASKNTVDVAEIRQEMNKRLAPGEDVEEIINNVMSSEPQDDDSDGDTETADDVEDIAAADRSCTGISDIIITGETLPRHGAAWNHYRFYGRVRQWDGLIAIVRVPARNPRLGNFVGSWRVRTSDKEAIPLEGPFVVSRV